MATGWIPVGLLVAGILIAASVYLGGWIAGVKGREWGEGAMLGACLGPLGWIVEGLLPNGWDVPAPKQVVSPPIPAAAPDPVAVAPPPIPDPPPASSPARIEFRCECGKLLVATPDLAGRNVRCSRCKATRTVPGPTAP